jgi:integrase
MSASQAERRGFESRLPLLNRGFPRLSLEVVTQVVTRYLLQQEVFVFLSRRNGIYYLWYDTPQGRRRKVSTGTTIKPEALRFLRSFREQDNLRAKLTPLLSSFMEQLFEHIRSNMTPGTLRIYGYAFKHFLEYNDDLRLDKYTPYHFDRYKICRLKLISPVAVNIDLRALKAGFGIAKRWQLIQANPFEGLVLVQVPERDPIFYSQNDFQRLLSAIQEDWLRNIVIFSALIGMRQGEILSLRWSQVDLERSWVRIESSKVFRTKSGKKRTIPLSRAANALLVSLKAGEREDFVFTLNGQQLKSRWVGAKLRYYLRANNFPRGLNFHSLRHSFASWLAMDGVSIYQISKLLGHSDVSVTQDFYAHLQPDSLREAVNRISVFRAN